MSTRFSRAMGGLLVLVPALFGFDSYNHKIEDVVNAAIHGRGLPGLAYGLHQQVSYECLQAAGVIPPRLQPMSEKVSDIDFDDWYHSRHYEAKNHCDRPGGGADGATKNSRAALADALGYFRHSFAEALNSFRKGDWENTAKILPRALHVQEDFFSHSNYVDLAPESQMALRGCWLEPSSCIEAAPGSPLDAVLTQVLITGYDPRSKDPYRPSGDTYSHADYAKDNPTYAPEAMKHPLRDPSRTKFEIARSSALEVCVAVVRHFVERCSVLEPSAAKVEHWEDQGPTRSPQECAALWDQFRQAHVPEDDARARDHKRLGL